MSLNGAYVDLSQSQVMESSPLALSDAELEAARATIIRHVRALYDRLTVLDYERGRREQLGLFGESGGV